VHGVFGCKVLGPSVDPAWCRKHEVTDLETIVDETIRNQTSMALPPQCFRAHKRDGFTSVCASLNLGEGRLKLWSGHVRFISGEARRSPMCHKRLWWLLATTAQGVGPGFIRYPASRQVDGQSLRGEMWLTPTDGVAAHVDHLCHACRTKDRREFVRGSRTVADCSNCLAWQPHE
jgi:hypothetical protein